MRFPISRGAIALVAAASACTTETAPPPPPPSEPLPTLPSGTLVLDWTIDGTVDPNRCVATGAAVIRIFVTFDNGASAGTFEQDCVAFATSISLAPGRYTGGAFLVDVAGNPRTTTVPLDAFDIVGNDELRVPVDFPASSFF